MQLITVIQASCAVVQGPLSAQTSSNASAPILSEKPNCNPSTDPLPTEQHARAAHICASASVSGGVAHSTAAAAEPTPVSPPAPAVAVSELLRAARVVAAARSSTDALAGGTSSTSSSSASMTAAPAAVKGNKNTYTPCLAICGVAQNEVTRRFIKGTARKVSCGEEGDPERVLKHCFTACAA